MNRYIIVCMLIMVGLCLSKNRERVGDTNVSLVLSRSMYVKQVYVINMAPQILSKYSSKDTIPTFNTNIMLMQTENDSLQTNKSIWKQTGIYGLELLGASTGSAISLFLFLWTSYAGDIDDSNFGSGVVIYCISNSLIASSTTWTMGRLLGQKGSWWKSAVGSCVGSLIGGMLIATWKEGNPAWGVVSVFLVAPPIGATVGYNF